MKQGKLLLIMLLIGRFCSAQITMSYTIGCIGNTNAKEPVYSSPVIVTGKSCFSVANGVNLFNKKSKDGVFTTACEVVAPVRSAAKLVINAYPNPVVSNVTVKSVLLVPAADLLLLTMYTAGGIKVREITTNAQLLSEGVNIQMSGLPKGIYIGKISGARVSADFKLIKID